MTTHHDRLKRAWITRRNTGAIEPWNKIHNSVIPIETIRQLYFEEKRGTHYIATKLGYSQTQIRRWMISHDLKLRSHKEAGSAEWSHSSYVKSQMKARNRTTENKAEIKLHALLEELFPGRFKWVGGGELVINGKCPDFADDDKTLIEMFGNYWHTQDEVTKRIEHFTTQGYTTHVIWESELIDMLSVRQKLLDLIVV